MLVREAKSDPTPFFAPNIVVPRSRSPEMKRQKSLILLIGGGKAKCAPTASSAGSDRTPCVSNISHVAACSWSAVLLSRPRRTARRNMNRFMRVFSSFVSWPRMTSCAARAKPRLVRITFCRNASGFPYKTCRCQKWGKLGGVRCNTLDSNGTLRDCESRDLFEYLLGGSAKRPSRRLILSVFACQHRLDQTLNTQCLARRCKRVRLACKAQLQRIELCLQAHRPRVFRLCIRRFERPAGRV